MVYSTPMAKKTNKKIELIERALDERVSKIMGLPDIMRVASAPSPIWIGQLLAWLPEEIMIQRAEDAEWTVCCDGLETEAWSISVALCRMIILLHEREVSAEVDG